MKIAGNMWWKLKTLSHFNLPFHREAAEALRKQRMNQSLKILTHIDSSLYAENSLKAVILKKFVQTKLQKPVQFVKMVDFCFIQQKSTVNHLFS